MPLFFRSQKEFDLFFFGSSSSEAEIILPEQIEALDLLLFLQASLDMLRPVIIAAEKEKLRDLSLDRLKSKHFHLEKNQYIFLNFSVRNSLSKFNFTPPEILCFDDIYNLIEKNHFFPK